MQTRTIGLIPHPTKAIDHSVEKIQAWRAANHLTLLALEHDAARVGDDVQLVDEEAFCASVDAVIALGGDGTMLGAMRLVAGRPVPVLGVNYGNVGFLVEVDPSELPEALERLMAQDFQLEPHHALEVTLTQTGTENSFLAFNDVAVARRPGSGVVSADLFVDETPYGYYRADALVIATSGGSTAYNYAAGGPILSPAVAASVVTPVASMSGIDRAVVLSQQEKMRLSIAEGTRSAALEIDGRVMADIGEGCELSLQLRADAGMVLRLNASRHANQGRIKLSLLDLPLRRDQLLDLVPPEIRARVQAPRY
jgi:NAD+ kinase